MHMQLLSVVLQCFARALVLPRHLSAFQPPSSLQLAARKRRGFKLAACQEDAFDAVAIVQQPP
eukprot:3779727-Amphidinium_carterae.1